MTFGGCLKLFRSVKDIAVKEKIANAYKLRSLGVFDNFIQSVVYVRNMCSHGGVLYDLTQPKGISKIPSDKYLFNNRQSLDASIKVIRYLLAQISVNREVEMDKKLADLFGQFKSNTVIKNVIRQKINYTL